MPWHKVNGHSECPSSRPWAVVKDDDNSVVGCHASEAEANAQLAALNANEGDNSVAPKVIRVPKSAFTTTITPTTTNTLTITTQSTNTNPIGLLEVLETAPVAEAPADEIVEAEVNEDGSWWGTLAVEGVRTGDGRKFAENSLEWRELPLSLYWQRRTADGHMSSVIVGSIDNIWRDGNKIMGSGKFNLGAPEGGESWRDAHDAFQLVRDGFMRGVSVTLDDIRDNDVELIWPETPEGEAGEGEDIDKLFMEPEEILFHHGRVIDGTLTGQPALQEAFIQIGTPDASVMPPAEPAFGVVWAHTTGVSDGRWDFTVNMTRLSQRLDPAIARQVFAYVGVDAGQGVSKSDCKFLHHEISEDGVPGPANLTACAAGIGILNGNRGGTTLTDSDRRDVYAHLAAHLRDAGREAPPLAGWEEAKETASLTAALAVPVSPPTSWFENPEFTEITPLMVGDDGWVRGHLAKWGTCHTSFAGTCVTPPFEEEFAYFTTGEIVTREGNHIPVGQLTLGTGHAPANLGARPAAVHYDHTGFAVADVVAGADEHGIWVAGALCPDVDELTVRRLRASALSGDWRRIGNSLRLVAALVVNVPGFPIPRTRTNNRNGDQTALVAAGIVMNDVAPPREVVSDPKAKKLKERVAASIGRDAATRIRELTERVHAMKGA